MKMNNKMFASWPVLFCATLMGLFSGLALADNHRHCRVHFHQNANLGKTHREFVHSNDEVMDKFLERLGRLDKIRKEFAEVIQGNAEKCQSRIDEMNKICSDVAKTSFYRGIKCRRQVKTLVALSHKKRDQDLSLRKNKTSGLEKRISRYIDGKISEKELLAGAGQDMTEYGSWCMSGLQVIQTQYVKKKAQKLDLKLGMKLHFQENWKFCQAAEKRGVKKAKTLAGYACDDLGFWNDKAKEYGFNI